MRRARHKNAVNTSFARLEGTPVSLVSAFLFRFFDTDTAVGLSYFRSRRRPIVWATHPVNGRFLKRQRGLKDGHRCSGGTLVFILENSPDGIDHGRIKYHPPSNFEVPLAGKACNYINPRAKVGFLVAQSLTDVSFEKTGKLVEARDLALLKSLGG
jgi:hypothetical protein